MKKIGRAALVLAAAAVLSAGGSLIEAPETVVSRAEAAQADQQWTWIASDQKYGKFFAPSNVQVKSSVNGVATCISAWIKTVYTPGGAQETIGTYGIEASIPDPRSLAYSLALVEVIPQERKIFYVQENFYNADGKVIWSKVYEPPKDYEVNHQKFDEDYYVALVDQVFHHGERAQKDAPDRWKQLWATTGTGGVTTVALADFTTMRLVGDNLVYWEWQETQNKAGQVTDIKFMKKALNYEQGTEKVISAQYWTPADADFRDVETDGRYVVIEKDSPAYHGLERLRAIVKGYQYWLNRYRTDLPLTTNAKRDAQDKSSAK